MCAPPWFDSIRPRRRGVQPIPRCVHCALSWFETKMQATPLSLVRAWLRSLMGVFRHQFEHGLDHWWVFSVNYMCKPVYRFRVQPRQIDVIFRQQEREKERRNKRRETNGCICEYKECLLVLVYCSVENQFLAVSTCRWKEQLSKEIHTSNLNS